MKTEAKEIDHLAVFGPTKCGKSNLVKWYCQAKRREGIPVLCCDPIGDPAWKRYADFVTDDPFKLLAKAKRCARCIIVLDEGGEYLLNTTKAEPLKWFARRSRHLGHQCIFMAQNATAIHPTYRSNAGMLFLFRCAKLETEAAVRDFADDRLIKAMFLPRFHYLQFDRTALTPSTALSLGITPRMAIGKKKR